MDAREGLELFHHLHVWPGEHAVAADVGVDDGIHAIIQEGLHEGEDLLRAAVHPAVGGYGVAMGVHGDGDMLGAVFLGRLDGEVGRRHSLGADDDAIDAVIQVCLDGFFRADAAAHFDGDGDGFAHGADDVRIHAAAFESAVQIHHVEVLRPQLLPFQCHFHRVIAVDREIRALALFQADAVSALYIYCGKYFHLTNHSAICFQIWTPTGPDFSG